MNVMTYFEAQKRRRSSGRQSVADRVAQKINTELDRVLLISPEVHFVFETDQEATICRDLLFDAGYPTIRRERGSNVVTVVIDSKQ